MVEEKTLTKGDLVEVLGTFTEDVLLPKMQEMIDDNFDKKVKPEINKAKQEMMDYTDRRVGESEGRLNIRIDSLDKKINVLDNKVSVLDNKVSVLDNKVSVLDNKVSSIDRKMGSLIDTLENKDVISEKDVLSVKRAGLEF